MNTKMFSLPVKPLIADGYIYTVLVGHSEQAKALSDLGPWSAAYAKAQTGVQTHWDG